MEKRMKGSILSPDHSNQGQCRFIFIFRPFLLGPFSASVWNQITLSFYGQTGKRNRLRDDRALICFQKVHLDDMWYA